MRFWILPLSLFAITFVYFMWVRPTLRQREALSTFYREADNIWLDLGLRLKKRWLMICSVALIVGPELPGYLTQLGMLDLSVILPPEWAFWASKMLGFAGMLLRIVLGVPRPDPEPMP